MTNEIWQLMIYAEGCLQDWIVWFETKNQPETGNSTKRYKYKKPTKFFGNGERDNVFLAESRDSWEIRGTETEGWKNRNSAPGGGFETSLSLLGLTMKKRVRIFLRTTMNASLHAAGPLPLKKEKRPLKLKVSPRVVGCSQPGDYSGQLPG